MKHRKLTDEQLDLYRPARARVLCADGITRCVALTLEEDLS